MPTIYNLKLPRIILKQRAPKIDIVPDTICPKFNDLLSMFWQIFVCSAKSAKDNNKKTAYNYLISRKKSATILVCLAYTIYTSFLDKKWLGLSKGQKISKAIHESHQYQLFHKKNETHYPG